jgi:uncharacterized protein with GYD domain
MPTYILMSTLTPDGRQTLHKDPDRLEQVNREISDFGCKVVAQYAVLGECDFVTVIEAPDNETVAHLSVDLGSRGTVKVSRPGESHPQALAEPYRNVSAHTAPIIQPPA